PSARSPPTSATMSRPAPTPWLRPSTSPKPKRCSRRSRAASPRDAWTAKSRLLLDSPAARDPVRRKLLQDLELVLVQIVQLSPKSSARDRDLIKGALTDDEVMTRLRTAIPVKGT